MNELYLDEPKNVDLDEIEQINMKLMLNLRTNHRPKHQSTENGFKSSDFIQIFAKTPENFNEHQLLTSMADPRAN